MTTVVGIDKATFYTPYYYIDLKTLAVARGVDPEKYTLGLGQKWMSVVPPDEDIVTLAANAAQKLLTETEKSEIDLFLFATESGIDQSKSAGIFVHHLLGLSKHCRVIELKQACYSATAGLQMALDVLRQHPTKKILLIASDIARYGLNTTGESSQGGGAVAMLLTNNPRLIAIEKPSGFCTEDAMDFWRPNYRDEALVEGKYSCDLYLRLLKESWQHYLQNNGHPYAQHDYFCYHTPLPRLAEKAHQKLAMINGYHKADTEKLEKSLGESLAYARSIGNCYTASLYLCLISLLENTSADFSGKRIGFYSYGSGCSGEFFSGLVQKTYHEVLHKGEHLRLLNARHEVNVRQYENFYTFSFPTDGSKFIVPHHDTGPFRLAMLNLHKRTYAKA